MRFSELKEYEAFRIKGIDENLVKRSGGALRYNERGVFLGRMELTADTEVITGDEDGSAVYA
jgi:hypothetical protein